jgi:hypothetical protein
MGSPNPDPGTPPDAAPPPPDSFRPTDTVRLDEAQPLEPVDQQPPPSPDTSDQQPLPGSQTPHSRGMAAILARRREQIAREQEYGDRMMGTPESTPVPVETAPPAPRTEPEPPRQPRSEPPQRQVEPAARQAAPAPEPPPPPQPPQPRLHRIVVRGQPIDLNDQDVLRAAQFAIEQEANRREQEYLRQQQPPPPPEPQFDRARLIEHVKALQYGDEEAAAEALAQLGTEISRTVRPAPSQPVQQIDPAVIADQVYHRVSNVQSLESALVRFQNDYADIVSDPQATKLAALEAEELRTAYAQQGINANVEQIMREAADRVRATIGRWRGGSAAPTPLPITPAPPAPANANGLTSALAANGNRVAVKRSIPQVPAAASAPQPADTPNVKSGVTGSEVVNWMRRTRGQPVYR